MKAANMSWRVGNGWTGPEEPRARGDGLALCFGAAGAQSAVSGIGRLRRRIMTIAALSGKAA